jgi:hypothetical protein
VAAEEFFDGRAWRGAATVCLVDGAVGEVVAGMDDSADILGAVIVPGCTDWGVSAHGYREQFGGDPFAPERAFAELSLGWGVTEVVDVNNTPAALSALQELGARDQGPRVIGAAARLARRPVSRTDRVVGADGDAAVRAAVQQVAGGADLISCRDLTPDASDAVAEHARAAGLAVAVPFADPDTPSLRVQTPDAMLVVPQLAVHERWAVDGLLAATDAPLAAGFLPYARHFQAPRGRVGRSFARAALRDLYGHRPPADPGRVLAWSETRSARLVASSGAGWPALVPGKSLWRDVALLAEALGPVRALRAACQRFDGRPAIDIGRRAQLVVSAVEDPRDAVGEIGDRITDVIVGRTCHDATELRRRQSSVCSTQEVTG